MKARTAFTLIELLIVVAIIAILAAIAVPNFLEAQTRAKVSRTLADIRSMKTALESYRVDGNKYPTGRSCGNVMLNGYPEGPAKYRLVLLTTPIAYMTSLPDDPFKTAMLGMPTACDRPSFIYLLLQYHPRWHDGPSDPNWVAWPNGLYPEYVLVSKGPSREPSTTIQWIPYDPTNGTVSNGELIQYGP